MAQQRQIAKVEDVGDIDGLGHKARAKDLELGEVKTQRRQGFEPHEAHVLRRDADIDDRLFVLALQRYARADGHPLALGVRRTVVDEDLKAAHEIVLEGEIRRGEFGRGIAREKAEAINAKARTQIQVDDQPQNLGAFGPSTQAQIESALAVVVDELGQFAADVEVVGRGDRTAARFGVGPEGDV